MSVVNDIPTGLRVPAQVPLDAKLYVASEASLLNLGIASNLAFTYYQGMIIYCVAERKRYEWREGAIGEVGLLPVGFTYPNPLIVNGVDYSGKTFNFFLVVQNLTISNVGIGTSWYKGFNVGLNTHEFKTFTSTGLLISFTGNEVNIENKSGTNVGFGAPAYKGVNSSTKLHEFRTFKSMNPAISINQVGDEIQFNATFYNTIVQAGTGITVTGNGTAGNPYVISAIPAASPWLPGDIKEVSCTAVYIATNFVASGINAGLGIGERAGWAICNGNNGTPNDKGRVVIGYGTLGAGTNYPTVDTLAVSARGGAETHTLLEAEMPQHNHGWTGQQGIGWPDGSGDSTGAGSGGSYPRVTQLLDKGNNQPHNNMQPYVVRLKIMKL